MYFYVTVQPEWENDTVSALNIVSKMDVSIKKGERMAALIRELVKIPFCPMENLIFTDEEGEIPYTFEETAPEMGFVFRKYFLAERDTKGEISYSYRILPRVQPEGYRSSPYFDLVAEKGGVNGAGNTFLVHPADMQSRLDYQLTWDLSLLPEGCRGIWSLGAEQTVSRKDITAYDTIFTFYAVGKVKSIERGAAGFYWFDEMPIDAEEAADTITKMFLYMAEKFQDKGGDYRVFARRNHFHGGGGTALQRSYIFGYDMDGTDLTVDALQSLLAHEMVHNWPTMSDDPPGAATWYVEGSAEYYSVMVRMEMGLAPLEEIAKDINEKAATYYENPYRHYENLALGKLYWEDRAAQRLPYARGIIYLANLDAQIQRATKGEKSLLDIELALLKLEHATSEDFLRIGKELAGFDLEPEWKAMCNGEELIPDPEAFGGNFKVVPCKAQVNRAAHRGDVELTGEVADGYRWEVKETRV